MSTSLPYFPEEDTPPTFLCHQHTRPRVHHAETDSSSNFRIHTAFKTAALQQFNIATGSRLDQKYGLQVYDIDLHHLPNIGWLHVDHQFYVEISIDDSTTPSLTTLKKPNSMPWKSKHEFDVYDSTTLTLKVFAHRQFHDDQYIGIVQGRVEQFLGYPGIQQVILEQLTCINPQGDTELLRSSLEFKVSSTVDHEKLSKDLRSSHGRLDAVRTPLPPTVQIYDIHLHHLPRIGLVSSEDRKFYVHASVDEHYLMSTPPVKLQSLWTTKLELNVWALSTISLKVFAKRQIHEDQYVGMVQERVETLLAHHGTKIYRLIPSDAHGDQLPPCGSMEFKIMPLYGTIEPSMTRHVERQSAWTTGAPEGVSYTPSLDSSNSGSAVSTLFDNDSDWVAESLPSSVASNDVRNEAKLREMLWEDAVLDVQKVVGLDPSSYHGYELKHEALHGAQQYGEAIAAFEIMLSKLNAAPDTRNTPKLLRQYITSFEAAELMERLKQ
ncbi:hypothetical protein M405DRAFT_837336 [Rhizopogon salebrosus TDB-379]|nr:hypothetical protein M405DRAFT_837336 [Rhizopogon salebrosus TDB-379]